MNKRELLLKTAFEADVPEEKLDMALRVLMGRDVRKAEVAGYLSVNDTMKYIGNISRVHLWHLRKKGLPCHNVGSRIIFKPTEVDEWIVANSRRASRQELTQPSMSKQ